MATTTNKSLSTAANLANLLPTGTTLAFQALMPSFTNKGSCLPAHKYLTSSAIIIFSIICLTFSFTDSFIASNGKLYYGIATFKGLCIFNKDEDDDVENGEDRVLMRKYRIRVLDFVHAICGWIVFVVYALCSSDVQRCLFPDGGENGKVLVENLPLAVGAAVSFLFALFPTRRRGIGYADAGNHKK